MGEGLPPCVSVTEEPGRVEGAQTWSSQTGFKAALSFEALKSENLVLSAKWRPSNYPPWGMKQ